MQINRIPGAFPAMVKPVPQPLASIYPADQALRSGTLFPQLDKPMHGCHAASAACTATEAQSLAFAAWEVRLYLDTHPCDERALALYRDLCAQLDGGSYACAFAGCSHRGWNWLDDPWPWELGANKGRG